MLKKIDLEIRVGGICATIAIIAIIWQMSLSNFSYPSIVEGIKEISTTIVAVLVFLFAIKNIFPKKEVETYDSVLEKGFQDISSKYRPLLNKAEIFEDTATKTKKLLERIVRLNLITNFKLLLKANIEEEKIIEQGKKSNSSNSVGAFVDFDLLKPTNCKFYINETTFGKSFGANTEEEFRFAKGEFGAQVASCINVQFKDFCIAKASSDGTNVTFKNSNGLSSPAEAKELVKLIEYVLLLYIVKN